MKGNKNGKRERKGAHQNRNPTDALENRLGCSPTKTSRLSRLSPLTWHQHPRNCVTGTLINIEFVAVSNDIVVPIL